MNLEEREYQDKDVDYAMSHGTADKIIHCAPTGSGKTIIQAKVCKRELDRGDSTAILTPRDIIFNQTANVVTELCGIENVSILRAKRPDEIWNPVRPVHIVMWPTLIARAKRTKGTSMEDFWFPNVQRVLIDECFVAGTQVDGRPIELIGIGDLVWSFNHASGLIERKPVLAISKREAKKLISIATAKRSITCTLNHPIFANGEYKRAADLCYNDSLATIGQWHEDIRSTVQGMRQKCELHGASAKGSKLSVTQCCASRLRLLLGEMSGYFCGSREIKLEANGGNAQGIIGTNDSQQSDAFGSNKSQGFYYATSYGMEASRPWWKRPSANASADYYCVNVGMGNGSSRMHKTASRQRLSYLLQTGRWKSRLANWCRNKWQQSLQPETTSVGREKETFLGVDRVERVVVHKQAGGRFSSSVCPDGFVYNLEVEGNNNYFANGVLVHNCHLSMAPKILEILHYYAPKAKIDGYTATPARQTGKGLGRFFTQIKHVTTVRQLVKDGYLCPVEYWGGRTPDMAGIRIVRGDFEVKKLSAASQVLVGDVVDNWLRLASDRHTIVFAVDIAHCEMLAHRFKAVGIRAAALHVHMDQDDRDRTVEAFKSGNIQVLCNVSIASYGFDAPSVNCIVIARKTLSIVLHLQMIGRGMRPGIDADGNRITDPEDPDFKICRVLDHAGNVPALGQADDLFRWRLDEGKKATARVNEKGEPEEPVIHTCEDCGHIFSQARVCPKCGWKVPFTKRDVDTTEADLVRIGKSMVERLPEGWPSHEIFFSMLLHHQQRLGYSDKWAAVQFKEKCDTWPPWHWNDLAPLPPSKRIKNWLHSRRIAYAKGREKAAAST